MIKTKTHLVFQAMTTGLLLAAGMVTAQAQPYPTAVLADHPTSYWRLQETSGTVAHDSADSDNGSYTNVLLQQQGFTNSNAGELSVGFGGPAGFSADSYVGQMTADFASTTNTAFSAEAWINTGGSPGGAIVGKGWGGGGEEFFVDCGGANGQYRFFIRNASGTAYNATSAVFPDGNWHHIAGVCDEVNGHIYLYLDGQVIASATASGGIQTTTNLYMTIGARQSSATTDYNLQFNGDISDVAIYPYALTAGQVATHYLAAGIPPTITLQPTNFVSVNAGGTVTLTAAATGSKPLSYQWTTNGVAMAGQTNATFVVSNVPANMNGDYIVLNVTNAYGSAQANGASLNVIAGGPQITSDVGPAQLTLYQGLPVTYSVSVAGSLPFYYQWQANGTNIAGATNSSFSVNALRGTNTYNVAISNSYNGGSRSQSSIAALVGVPAPTGVYPAAIVASQPAAYWRLDEASGAATANDYAGGHDGNYNQVQLGAPGYSAVDPDTAAEFGPNAGFPTDSYMQEIDNSGQGLPVIDFAQQGSNVNFSLEAWVKGPAGQPASGSAIVAKGVSGSDPFVLDASAPNSKFRFNIRKAGGGGTAAIYSPVGPDGNWHHLVAVCDETDGAMFLYVDGQNTGTITGIGGTGLFETSVPLSVGAQSSGSDFNYQFNGIIDEVSVYNYALTASQVLAHYNAAPEPPYFTAEPPATIVGYPGENVTLSAAVLGSAPMTNQWFVNSSSIPGQTNLFLVLTNIAGGTNTYVLKVSNAYGSTNSIATVLQVPIGTGPPSIVTDVSPLAASLYTGQSITYAVTASGATPLSYQWWFNGNALPNATNSTYTVASVTTTNAGSYYCVISNSINSIASSTALLAVVPPPANPYSLTVIADHPVAYYRMDETNGSTIGYDYVGGNNGIYSNTAQITHIPGCFGSSYDSDTAAYFGTNGVLDTFLGTITNVDFAVPNGQNGAFSIEAWAKGLPGINQLSGGTIIGKGVGNADEQFALDAHTGFRFYVRNAASATSVAGAQAAPTVGGSATGWQMDGQWHYLVGVCDQANSNILLYVDGSLIGPNIITNGAVPPLAYALDLNHNGSTGTNGVIYTLTGVHEPADVGPAYWYANGISIGSRNKGATTAGETLDFQGGVDEVALYNYALTPLQVSNHYAVAMDLPVSLYLQTTNGHTVLTWSSAWVTSTLQSTTNLATGPWTPVSGAAPPYTVPVTGSAKFYRVKLY